MIAQLYYWGRLDLSYRGRSYTLCTYVRSLATFLEAYVRPSERRVRLLTALQRYYQWNGRIPSGLTAGLTPASRPGPGPSSPAMCSGKGGVGA